MNSLQNCLMVKLMVERVQNITSLTNKFQSGSYLQYQACLASAIATTPTSSPLWSSSAQDAIVFNLRGV